MESQYGQWIARAFAERKTAGSSAIWFGRWAKAWLAIPFMLLVLLCAGGVSAQTNNYAYDANGRLVGVTQGSGSAQYSYDAMGNLVQISSVPAGQLAIFSFMPTHGTAGTQVLIEGQGFSATPASNTVSFNGTAATVVSASSTQLVTTVPTGATTGPISVTVGTQSATSAQPFTVDNTGLPPTISQVSPLAVSVNGVVTVTGTHLDPVPGNTLVTLGGRVVSPTSSSDTQLQFTVPSDASSGYVVVQTPYGMATSAALVAVLPVGTNASNVTSTGYATVNGQAASLNIGASGQMGAMLFSAGGGQWISLQASSITTTATSLAYTVYAPGNIVFTQGTISSASPSIHLPQLKANGNYLVIFQPTGAGAQLSVSVESDSTYPFNQAASVAAVFPGESKRVLVLVPPGQNSTFEVLSATTGPANQSISYTLLTQDGTSYRSGSITGSGGLNLGTVPASPQGSIYQVLVAPPSSATANVQLSLSPAVQGALNANPTSYGSVVPGQNMYFTLNVAQGANLEVTINNINITNGNSNSVLVSIYDPSGAQIAGGLCYSTDPGAGCTQHLWYVPAGKYSVVVQPSGSGLYSLNAYATADVTGPNIPTNGTANIALAQGQVERLTFNANRGDTIALNVSGLTTTPSGQYVRFLVYRPDVGAITINTPTYTAFSVTTSQTVNLSNLPVSGTYTVIVVPYVGVGVNAQFSVVAAAMSSVTTGGGAQALASNVVNQNVYFTFNATQGQNLELTFNSVSVVNGYAYQLDVQVFNAVGTQITSFTCRPSDPAWGCSQHLWYLAAGTYTVVVAGNGNMKFNALVQPGVVGPTLVTGGSANIALAAGQVEWMQFSANQGDNIVLDVSGITTTPSGQGVTFLVYRPDVGAITTSTTPYTTFTSSQYQTVNLSNLPVGGNYTVVAVPSNGIAANAQLLVASGIKGSLPTGGTPQSFKTTVPGQNLYLTFNATQGQNLELDFTNISITNASYYGFFANVYNAAGVQVGSASCIPPSPAGTCQAHLWGIDAGTYTVVVVANYGGTLGFNASVRPGIVEPALNIGGTENVVMNAGDVAWLPINANQGDSLGLTISGVTTTPTNYGVTVSVYRPDGGVIRNNTASYAGTTTGDSTFLSLKNLPATGTYWVVLTGLNGMAVSSNVSLSSISGPSPANGAATLTANGVPQSASTTQAGAAATLTFNANLGDNLELTVNGLTFNGVASAAVAVYDPYGVRVAYTTSCLPTNLGGNCQFPLWNLVHGTYTVSVWPNDANTTMGFSATLQPDVIGAPLMPNAPLQVNLGTGQVERTTFNANLGDTVALNLSAEASTAPTGQPIVVSVYRPDTGAVTQNNYYASTSVSGSGSINLQNLPASGTYTVVMSTPNGTPASAQLTLLPDGFASLPNTGTVLSFSGASGENGYATFTANQGDNLELTLNGLQVAGSGSTTTNVAILNSKNVLVASNTDCYPVRPGSSCITHLWNLPADTYYVVVYQSGDPTAALTYNLSLQPDVVGPALVPNTPATISLGSGQVQRFTFNANLGDTWALGLSNVNTTGPAGQPINVSVYRPDGGLITPSNSYASFNGTTVSTINLPALPVSGTYTVVVSTPRGTAGTGQLTLVSGLTGPVNANGLSQSYSGIAGQNVYANFSANNGDNLELSLSGLSIPGGTGQYVHVYVYNSSGAFITQDTGCYNSNAGGGCVIPLWNLPADTYSIVVTPNSSTAPYSFNMQLQPDLVGGTLSPNNPVSISLGVGQVERFTFNANLGDSVALNLSGTSTSPAGLYVFEAFYRPDTGAITTSNAFANGRTITGNSYSLTALPAAGTYTVIVSTSYGIPGQAQLTLVPQ